MSRTFIYPRHYRLRCIRKGQSIIYELADEVHIARVASRTGEVVRLANGIDIGVDDVIGKFTSYGWSGVELVRWV